MLSGKNTRKVSFNGFEYTVPKHVQEDIVRLLKPYEALAMALKKPVPETISAPAQPEPQKAKKDGRGR